jgi:uncharacterized protein (UPF0333 family)
MTEKTSQASTAADASIEMKETAGLSQGQLVRKRFFRHRAANISLAYLFLIILFVFSAGGIHLGSKDAPFTIPGWWHTTINDMSQVSITHSPSASS